MALMGFASSVISPSSWTQKPFFSSSNHVKSTSLLGFCRSSIALRPIAASSSNPVAEQWQEFKTATTTEDLSIVPIEQRWMFTLEEAVGPGFVSRVYAYL
ncbi:50S ribosomal protein L13 chloroplastic [Bienertia sinuspersici]